MSVMITYVYIFTLTTQCSFRIQTDITYINTKSFNVKTGRRTL